MAGGLFVWGLDVYLMSMKFSLDWNCVIEVEESRPQAQYVLGLVELHKRGEIEVGVFAASASENNSSRRFPGSAATFLRRIEALGRSSLPVIPMPAVWGLSYWDFCYYVDDSFDAEMSNLWKVINPNLSYGIENNLPEGTELTDELVQSKLLSKWRNCWCDVVSAYSHIHEQRDVFVTNNTRDFQRNDARLFKLGMKRIATPKVAFELVSK